MSRENQELIKNGIENPNHLLFYVFLYFIASKLNLSFLRPSLYVEFNSDEFNSN